MHDKDVMMNVLARQEGSHERQEAGQLIETISEWNKHSEAHVHVAGDTGLRFLWEWEVPEGPQSEKKPEGDEEENSELDPTMNPHSEKRKW